MTLGLCNCSSLVNTIKFPLLPVLKMLGRVYQLSIYNLGAMVEMGYKKEDVLKSLQTRAYDEAFGTYLLLGTKPSEVF